MSEISRAKIDRHMRRLRACLFDLVEVALPEGQQEAVKRAIRRISQTAWRGLLIDAGYSPDRAEDSEVEVDDREGAEK